jgi:hypothetical protein
MTSTNISDPLDFFRDADGRLHCRCCGVLIAPSDENTAFTACGPTCLDVWIVCPSDACLNTANRSHNDRVTATSN